METYAADGFDAFEECLNQELPQDGETSAALKRGLDALYRATQQGIDAHFGRFAQHASSTCFAVPAELMQAQDLAENLPSCSEEEEKALDEELRAMRKRLAHARALASSCDAQSAALMAEMQDHAAVAEQLRVGKENAMLPGGGGGMLGGGVPGGVGTCEAAAAAIVAAARQLQPLLEQAEEMQRRGNILGGPEGVMAVGTNQAAVLGVDPVVMAKSTLRHHFVQGSSLEVLKSINQRLNARKAAAVGGEASQTVVVE